MVWSSFFVWKGLRADAKTTTTTTTTTATDITTSHTTSRRINYHLLSQSKERQQYLLRIYVRTNNVGRIKDYYTSIQNYYYHRQQVLERTQQHRLDPPRRRRRRKRTSRKNGDNMNSSRNNNDINNNNNDDDDDDSIHIMIDFGGTGDTNNYYYENANDDDDDFSSICMEGGTETTTRGNPLLPVLDRPPNRHDVRVPLPHSHHGPVATARPSTTAPPLSSSSTLQVQPVYTMLDVDASIHAHYSTSSSSSSNGLMWWTILYYACFHHRYEIAVYLIEECYASLKCTDRYHNTILHWVCHSPQTTVSDSNDDDDKGDQRVSSSTLSLLQYIMECAPSLLLQRNDDGELPLHWLCRYGRLSLVQCMIQFFLSKQDYYYYYCMRSQNSIGRGNVHRPPPQSDTHGTTANPLASPDHDNNNNKTTTTTVACILHLLVSSAVVDHHHHHHRTPLDVARDHQHDRIVQYLVLVQQSISI